MRHVKKTWNECVEEPAVRTIAISLSRLMIFFLFLGLGLPAAARPGPDEALKMLKEGNERFASGKMLFPNSGAARRALAISEGQGKHAIATVVSCSDSRVPPEILFDTGLMDLFVIRLAGNVCGANTTGSVEYGLCHVNTPLLVVLGHSHCGAVTAVSEATKGHGHALERNIPPLVAPIGPAVKRAIDQMPTAEVKDLVPVAIEENVWQGIEDLFLRSAAIREMVIQGRVKVVGAMYDLPSGKVTWLPEPPVEKLLLKAEDNPDRAKEIMAGDSHAPEGGQAPAGEHH